MYHCFSISNLYCDLSIHRYNTNVAEALLEDGVNPNVADLEGCTPLITAASRGKSSIIQVLLNNQKTDINTQVRNLTWNIIYII